MWKTRPSACLSVTQYQRLITLSYFMKFLIWDLFKTLSRKRSFVKIDIVKARVDLDLWISNRTFHISLRIWTKEDVEDTQHRSAFISVVKMCVIQNHTLTKWATEIFARIFALGAISKKKNLGSCDVHKNSLTGRFCGNPFSECHTLLQGVFTKYPLLMLRYTHQPIQSRSCGTRRRVVW